MKRIVLAASATALVLLASSGYLVRMVKAANSDEQSSAAETKAIVTATTAFLNSLSADQRKQVQFPFTPQKSATAAIFASSEPGKGPPGGFVAERYGQAVWSNYPISDVPRPGLRLGGLSAAQHDAVMHLLQVALSPKGYQKVLNIMDSDQVQSESHPPYCTGIACYTIGIFGVPSTTAPWMLEYGGHHLGLNLTMRGAHGVITPTLTGAQPAVYTYQGRKVRALAAENDKAFDLLNALNQTQRKQAILNYHVADLVLSPGHEGDNLEPEGLKASAMNARQQAMLLDVISQWADIVNDAYAVPRMAEIKAGLNETYFAWSGPTTHKPGMNGTSYYRIQGPRLVIEFSPQATQGDPALHVHTVYRDPTNDYGIKFTGAR